MPNETETGFPSPMFGSKWLTVFVVELVVISIINGFTILTFARNRHLRKRTTYLIISLTIADLFVGTVSVPLHIYNTMTIERGSGFGWGKFILLFWGAVFLTCSLLHLALLSLERLHATLFPFRHCLMLDWVYFKAVACIWFIAVIPASAGAALYLIAPKASRYVWASPIVAVLFTVIVSYVIIALNVKRKAPPYSPGAVSSERKLTVTILVVIVLSPVTFSPFFLSTFVKVSTKVIGIFDEAEFDIKQLTLFFGYANSFVNPLVYTLRMKEFRKGARVWCGSENINTASRSQIIEMNKVTG
ncbi:G-protein coupled receptor 87-like [Acropora millepora]|uniref:G-protein coupled receptor 87-like n=1 Tax=Acropora millepora TaxID=45264 RepID=UPI001CF57939|nr:G-protein coupled receptor 87-like [Acropora millepora]XP_044171079.1 G-protein coupled receptor 87-like [Acropora millepora]XP_044171080.1 G-protein coupled receptor 87-like [Acropora millepora]